MNNPRNKQVRKVDRRELRSLFQGMEGSVKSVTLAPPLARLFVRRSHLLAVVAETIPPLRTHQVAVLFKPEGDDRSKHNDPDHMKSLLPFLIIITIFVAHKQRLVLSRL